MFAMKTFVWAGLMVALLSTPVAWAALGPAGKVEGLRGKVYAVSADGKVRKLRKGRPVFQGDTIQTKRRSLVSIRFRDDTKFALGANSAMSVDKFVYNESAQEDGFSAKVIKGAFRFLTGLVAKKKPRSVNVLLGITATIGVRGTNVGGELEGEMATVMLLEPEEEGRKTAIEVSNEHGAVTIDEPGFGTVVPDANSPPGPVRRMKLRTIQNLMRSMQSITRGLRTVP